MVKLRLKRIGKKQAPFYRIVAADSRVNRNGQYIELVGTFDPLKDEVKLDKELVLKWLSNGAQPTDTVRAIFSQSGILTAYHEMKVAAKATTGTKKKTVKTKTASAEAKPVKKTATKKPAVKKTKTETK